MYPTSIRSFLFALSCGVPLVAQDPAKPAVPAASAAAPAKPLQLGARLDGSLTLLDLDGKPVKAHDQMGKITVVNFYSIQCPIQRAWDKRLAQIQQDFAAQGVQFLHIDSNATEIGAAPPAADAKDSPYAKVKQHLVDSQLPFRVLVDHGNVVADAFDARTTPHVFVFGKDGRLVYKGLVDDDQKDRRADARNNYLRDVLGALAKGEAVEPKATKEEGCSIKRVKQAAPPAPAGTAPAAEAKQGK
jgi:hypothetical protein